MLASEGVVELVHNRGARVVSWSADDIDEVYRLRALLEGHGAALAAARSSDSDLKELTRLEDRFEAAVRRGQADVTAECNNELHAAVLRCSGSPRLATLLDVIASAPLVTQAIQHYGKDDVQRSIVQHRDSVTRYRPPRRRAGRVGHAQPHPGRPLRRPPSRRARHRPPDLTPPRPE